MLACDAGFECRAVEISEARVKRLQENLTRMGWVVPIDVGDACDLTLDEQPSVIVCDVPCSGSGVYAKHPEAVWMFDEETVRSYQEKQKALLTWALSQVKPGGFVIYSTCSIFSQENEEVVAACLGTHEHVPIDHPLLQARSLGAGCLPQDAGGGFYYACIQRSAKPLTDVPSTDVPG